jgi:hypothetical protein
LRKLTRIYFSFAQIRAIRGFKVGAGGGCAGFPDPSLQRFSPKLAGI